MQTDYTLDMSRTILLAGKEMSLAKDFAETAAKFRNVIVASTLEGPENKKKIAETISCYAWNKISPVSAHSLVLQCETDFDRLDEAVLYYDETANAIAYPSYTEQSCSQILNDLVAGYQYLTFELLSRFEVKKQTKKPSTLVFICKSDSKNAAYAHINPCVRAATSAFTAFAQSVAAQYSERQSVNIVLVHADIANEMAHTDTALTSWLCNYMDIIAGLKTKLSTRQSCVWVKPGARNPGGWFH